MRSAVLALLLLFLAAPALAGDGPAGTVSRVQGQAWAEAAGQRRTLSQNDPVAARDRLSTGPAARLEVRLADATTLTLGENSEALLQDFAFEPRGKAAALLLNVAKGAFRVITGEIAKRNPGAFQVLLPTATIGIRGTAFWGGDLPGHGTGVLLLSGSAVEVCTRAGCETLDSPLAGVMLPDAALPPQAKGVWAAAKVNTALATVRFDN